jgi:integrase
MLQKVDKKSVRVRSKKYPGVYIYTSTKREGDEAYYIQYRAGQFDTRVEKVGWKSEGYTQEKAAQIRSTRVQSVRHGDELPTKKKKQITFHDAFKSWYKNQRAKGIVNAPRHEASYLKTLEPILGNRKLSEITRDMVNGLTVQWREAGYKNGTIYHFHYLIRAIIRQAVDDGVYQGDNIMARVDTPRLNGVRERFLTKEQAQFLLEESKNYPGDLYLFSALGLATGMRYSEMMGIHGRDINYETSQIRVLGKGKFGGKIRHCPIPDKLMEIIKAKNLGDNEPLLKDVTNHTFKNMVNRLGFNKGVAPRDQIHSVSAHTLRHTFASWQVMQGTPLPVVQQMMGHSNIQTTMRYAHLAPGTSQQWANRMMEDITL